MFSLRITSVLAGLLTCLLTPQSHAGAQELKKLHIHAPIQKSDLGVGLWAWPIPCDADGDGDFDLIVSCPDKPSNGVWFFENPSGSTAENPLPAFLPAKKLSRTVHYLTPSYVDGKLRVLSPGVEYQNFTSTGIEKSVKIPIDSKLLYRPQWNQPKGPKLRHNQWSYVDYDGDGVLDLIVGIEDWSEYGWDDAWNEKGEWTHGPLHGFVLCYRNSGTNDQPKYEPYFFVEADGKPVDTFGCPSPNFADFDGDGDLDLLCGEFLDGFTYFENIGTRTEPRYAAGRRLTNVDGAPLVMDLEMIVPVAFDWDLDGDLDLIVGDEDGRVAFVENVTPKGAKTPVFKSPVYFQQQADTLKCGALATPFVVDWDADGDLDIICGNTAGYIEFIENRSGPGVAEPRWARPKKLEVKGRPFRVMAGPNGSVQGPAEAKWGYTTLNVADWDGDGKLDIIYNSIWGKVEWLKNIGSIRKPALAEPQPIEVEWEGPTPKPAWTWWNPKGKELVTQWRTTPVVHDFNNDGLPDLAMLDQEGYLAFFERARKGDKLVLLPPKRIFANEKGEPLRLNSRTAGGSGRRKLAVVDWDGDGQLDLLLNSANADLYRGLGMIDGTWRFQKVGPLAKQNIEGHDVSPAVTDFDGDGIPDFLGGAEDGRLYHLRNPRSASVDTTVRVPAAPGVLSAEFIYDEAPFHSCHASTIVETRDGELLIAWFGGSAEGNSDVGIWISRWENNRWSEPVEVATGQSDGGKRFPTWNPVLFQPKSGPLLLFYKVGPTPWEWWGMLITSTDGGRTWSEPVRLPDGILGPIKNKPIELAPGTILSGSSVEGLEPPPSWQIHFERSTDGGTTWEKISVPAPPGSPNAIQPSILKLADGRLQALGRTKEDKIFWTLSSDQGKTWSELKLLDLPNPNSGTDAVTIADGRHLLIYNHTKRGRTPLNLAVSEDGQNWSGAVVFESDPGEFSYPAIIQTSDGLVHVTYTWNRRKLKHVVLDPAKLKSAPIKEGQWPEEVR
jgi:predicted neuraminidase